MWTSIVIRLVKLELLLQLPLHVFAYHVRLHLYLNLWKIIVVIFIDFHFFFNIVKFDFYCIVSSHQRKRISMLILCGIENMRTYIIMNVNDLHGNKFVTQEYLLALPSSQNIYIIKLFHKLKKKKKSIIDLFNFY